MDASGSLESSQKQTFDDGSLIESSDAVLLDIRPQLSAIPTSSERVFSGERPILPSNFQLAMHLGAGYHSRGNEGRHRALGAR
jgi:hypothetical protein